MRQREADEKREAKIEGPQQAQDARLPLALRFAIRLYAGRQMAIATA